MKVINTIKGVKRSLLIILIGFNSNLYGQYIKIFEPHLRDVFENELVSNVSNKWEKNGFNVSEKSPITLEMHLNEIYDKYKANKKSVIIVKGHGISTDLRAAKLEAESSALGNLLESEETNIEMIDSVIISKSNNKLCLDNVTNLEILKSRTNKHFEVIKFYIYLKGDLEYFSKSRNCFEGQTNFFEFISEFESVQNNVISSRILIDFLNEMRTIRYQYNEVNHKVITEVEELTRNGIFQLRTNNEKEEIIKFELK